MNSYYTVTRWKKKGILLIDDDVLLVCVGIDAFHERVNGLYYFITCIDWNEKVKSVSILWGWRMNMFFQ